MWNPFKKRKPELYNKCNILPIHNFNEVSNGDLSYMKIDRNDNVPIAELENAWLSIIDEYFVLSKNIQGIENLKRKSVLIRLEKKMQVYEAVKICLNRNVNVDEIMTQYGINAVDLPQYMALIKYDIDDLNSMLKKTDTKGENEFDKMFAIALKSGFQINRFTTTVSEWIQIIKIIEEQNKQNKNDGTGI